MMLMMKEAIALFHSRFTVFFDDVTQLSLIVPVRSLVYVSFCLRAGLGVFTLDRYTRSCFRLYVFY